MMWDTVVLLAYAAALCGLGAYGIGYAIIWYLKNR